MAQQKPPSADSDTPERPQGDPWQAFGYLVSGVVLYGALGWALDRWLGTSFLVVLGILVGAGFGIYMTWAQYKPRPLEDKT